MYEAKESPVFKKLVENLRKRDKIGFKSYGKPMAPHDGRNMKLEKFEELIDLLVYFQQELMEDEEADNERHRRWEGARFQEVYQNGYNHALVDAAEKVSGEVKQLILNMKRLVVRERESSQEPATCENLSDGKDLSKEKKPKPAKKGKKTAKLKDKVQELERIIAEYRGYYEDTCGVVRDYGATVAEELLKKKPTTRTLYKDSYRETTITAHFVSKQQYRAVCHYFEPFYPEKHVGLKNELRVGGYAVILDKES